MEIRKELIKRILLIDDDHDDCVLFEAALSEVSSSIKVDALNVCEEVLQALDNCGPDVIFLDINLPKVNGFKCLKEIQSSAQHCRIPIIMYSSSNNPKEVNIAYGYGATLFFKKPTRYLELVESLKSILLMDWNTPDVIKQQYFREGKYHPFAL